jgi:RNA polymerase sigma factor (sigma-70 family)
VSETPTAAAITAVWRHESVRLVATLVRLTHDLDLAEDLAQDALVAALEQWPSAGVPGNPGAWLTAVARRRGIDQLRRNETLRRRVAELGHDLGEEAEMAEPEIDRIEDDVLRLLFLAAHPALPPESRAALTLRLVGGLTTPEIARAYLVKDATMGQRISRAKRTLVEAQASFELPTGAERRARLGDVMAVVYLVFNEGYAATAGDAWTRPELCLEAQRLARLLTGLVPDEPEVWGLQALLELQGSRLAARRDPDGRPVLLDDQDRSRWDQLLVRRGLAALGHAEELAAAGRPVGSYVLQAAIAACHARARRPEDTDWTEIAGLYDVLAQVAPGPVVEVNRAVAHGRAHGPDAGLHVLAAVADEPALAGSPLLPSVRGDLLERAGLPDQAAAAFREAASLTRNEDERRLLLGRAETCR